MLNITAAIVAVALLGAAAVAAALKFRNEIGEDRSNDPHVHA